MAYYPLNFGENQALKQSVSLISANFFYCWHFVFTIRSWRHILDFRSVDPKRNNKIIKIILLSLLLTLTSKGRRIFFRFCYFLSDRLEIFTDNQWIDGLCIIWKKIRCQRCLCLQKRHKTDQKCKLSFYVVWVSGQSIWNLLFCKIYTCTKNVRQPQRKSIIVRYRRGTNHDKKCFLWCLTEIHDNECFVT